MTPIQPLIDPGSDIFAERQAATLALVDRLRALEAHARDASARGTAKWAATKLPPNERVARLLDPDRPFLPLCSLAGWCVDDPDPKTSIAGAGQIAGIGYVSGVRCMVVATDAGISGGALSELGNQKIQRCQEIALENRLPFIHLVESAGANLLKYRVEKFVRGGAMFRNLALMSAAGLPVITVVHGPSAAGGAYMPGLSDHVIMVRGQARAYLAGPSLLRAATGEITDDEDLGGAEMHARISGLCEYIASDDADGITRARAVVAALDWPVGDVPPPVAPRPPRHDTAELAGVMPVDFREPVDMREVIARLVDDSSLLPFKPDYGQPTICGRARLDGHAIGIITNNGPLDPAGATKATHFIHTCCQSGTPILYLQNTTGFIVGRASEEAGMVKHGSKLIQALTNATVPQITVLCGASFGAGNYGMCGRAFRPRFLFSWPGSRTAVMGAEQAATTMELVAHAQAERRGKPVDTERLATQRKAITENFERQAESFITSGLLLDDGVIDPRDTRTVLSMAFACCRQAEQTRVRPMQFGVARA